MNSALRQPAGAVRAVIIAAGQGVDGLPQGMTEIGGRSLLARHLDQLFRAGVTTVDLVVGHEASVVIEHVATLDSRPEVAWHFNPRFELGSMLHLWAAEETLRSGEPILLMDANLLYHPRVLARLLDSPIENCFLLDRAAGADAEGWQFAMLDGRILDFAERLPAELEFDTSGAAVGLFKLGAQAAACLCDECARLESEGLADTPYQAVLRAVLLSCPLAFGFEDIGGLPWLRVDSNSSAERAGRRILPAIRADHPEY